jgi:tetratricopeptide (TPR) repeat protein
VATAPRPDSLADGPLRELVLALHELHRAAGKPGVRLISAAIRDRDDLRDTVSHETISAMLRGGGLPKWVKVECVVRQLAAWSVTGIDADREVRRFHQLWLAADDEPGGAPATPPRPVSRDFVVSTPVPAPTGGDHKSALPGPMLTNVPARSRHFTGRTAMLAEIRSVLSGRDRPLLALVGLGGVGKTQLAVEYVHRWATEYDMVWWVPAEQPSQAIASLASLGDQLGINPSIDMRQTVRGVLTALEASRLRWLLVYDNADQPNDLDALLPAAGGHVIVTSRNAGWAPVAEASLRVNVFSREESIGFLREWGVVASADDSDTLAEQLGDLPLALDQVCAMHTATGMPIAEYLRLFAEHFDELLAAGRRAGSRTTTVTTFVNVAADRLRTESVTAAHLLELLAFMAPSAVSISLLHRGRDGQVTPPLKRAMYSIEELKQIAVQLGRFGLAQVNADGQQIQLHRLVQLVVREALDETAAGVRRLDVHRLLAAVNPGRPDDSRTWTQHGEIGPHLVASDAVNAVDSAARQAVLDQIRYLERVGDFEASARLARNAVEAWRADADLGPEHELTIQATRHLANALRALGSYAESRTMIMDTLDLLRGSPSYGENHPVTLDTAAVAAFYLRFAGNYREALEMDSAREEILRRRYGPADIRTTDATSNLTINLRLIGDAAGALEKDSELVRILGDELGPTEPKTLVAVRNQAWDLMDLGRYGEAVELQRANLARRNRHDDFALAKRTIAVGLRRLGRYPEALAEATDNYRTCQDRFGPDHHLTLAAIMTYANTLRSVGDAIGARSLATEALDRYRRLFGEQNPLTLAAATNLAVVLRALGQWREAHSIDEVTYDETVRVLGPEHPQALVTAIGLANDLAHHHIGKDAVALGQTTLESLRRVRGETHPETWVCAVNLALDLGAARQRPHREADEQLAALLGPGHSDVLAAVAGVRLESDIEPPPT